MKIDLNNAELDILIKALSVYDADELDCDEDEFEDLSDKIQQAIWDY